jgi:antitoxin FitA
MSAIQVKNVPQDVHERLRSRARLERRSLSEYVLDVLQRDLALPTMREWLDQLEHDGPVAGVSSEQIVETIRQGRAERDAEISRAVSHSD